MKTPLARSLLLAALALFSWNCFAQPQENRPAPNQQQDRLERLEHRLNELAERQEQFMRRAGAQMERQGQMAQPGNERVRQPLPSGPRASAEMPGPGRQHKELHDLLGLLFLIGVICNILLAMWIFTDIRKRGEGSGIFIAMALVAGIPAAIIYALTRIGDKRQEAKT